MCDMVVGGLHRFVVWLSFKLQGPLHSNNVHKPVADHMLSSSSCLCPNTSFPWITLGKTHHQRHTGAHAVTQLFT